MIAQSYRSMMLKSQTTAKISIWLILCIFGKDLVRCHYRAMYVVLARYCYRKSSVCPSVCDVDVSWAYTLLIKRTRPGEKQCPI